MMFSPHQPGSEHDFLHGKLIEDTSLIRNHSAGCSECFAILFHRYCKLVFWIAWKVLRQQNEVEDIVQEVFLSIYTQRAKYDEQRGSVKIWISQLAHFKALTHRRLLIRKGQQALEDTRKFERIANNRSGGQNPERCALAEECLRSLNPKQRKTIEAILCEGYTLKETAEMLEESLANTRNLYYRGVKSIRLALLKPRPQAVNTKVVPSVELGPMMEDTSFFGVKT